MLQLIIRAAKLQQSLKFVIFQKAIISLLPIMVKHKFCAKSGFNCSRKVILLFSAKNSQFLEFPSIFEEGKIKREIFRQSWIKYLKIFPDFGTISLHHK